LGEEKLNPNEITINQPISLIYHLVSSINDGGSSPSTPINRRKQETGKWEIEIKIETGEGEIKIEMRK
jgi:hypothetical protein